MLYRFAGFTLNTETNELHHHKQPIPLTRQIHKLLAYLLAHPEQIHTKDDLIEHVWNGRIVSDNTVDQSISKLRKLLNECEPGEHIETVYGQGIKWVHSVSVSQESAVGATSSQLNLKWVAVLVTMTLMVVGWVHWQQPAAQVAHKPMVLYVPTGEEDNSWSQIGTEGLLTDLMNYTGMATLGSVDDKPRYVDTDSYIENQRRFHPALITTSARMSLEAGQYTLTINLNQQQQDNTKVFTGTELHQVMEQAMQWVQTHINPNDSEVRWQTMLPASSHVIELFMRSTASISNNDLEKARKQLELITEEAPEFLLARYQLADVLIKLNQNDQAMATIDTLLKLPMSEELYIAVNTAKAHLLDTLGDYTQTVRLYENLFDQYPERDSLAMLHARYDYAHTLLNMNQPLEAAAQLDHILASTAEQTLPDLQANVHTMKGNLWQRQGNMEQAQFHLQEALTLFERNRDALGTAKTYSAMARIANHQANYDLAETYLQESLAITRNVGFRLGEGATLNELAYVLMVQGEHNRARQLVQELLVIGTEIEYPAMQLAARQLFFDMAREQGQWSEAERHLQQHHALAEAIGHQRALIKNQMLELTLRVDAGQYDQTSGLITTLQQHIDEQQEQRMQPRLDWLSARIKLGTGQTAAAEQQLEQALVLARQSEDGESIININNTLAAMHLDRGAPELALQRLEGAAAHHPFALPHLRLKARAQQAMGDAIKALETMTLCQQQAADLWTEADTALLNQLANEAQTAVTTPEA